MTKDTGASEPVGTLHAIVLDVNDLESCAGFWSEVLGKEISFKTDKYCRIGGDDDPPSSVASKGTGATRTQEPGPHRLGCHRSRGGSSACSGPWRNQARRNQRVRNHMGGNGRPGRQRVLSSPAFVNRIKPSMNHCLKHRITIESYLSTF